MGQRINIQYSVDIDELPREVGRLLESAFNEYQLLQVDCRFDTSDATMSYKTVERLDCIRLALASIDHRLSDASKIIAGYLDYKAHEASENDVSPGVIPDTTDLQTKLEDFKALMETAATKEDEVSD